ncbi:MAG: hypothetical protein ACI9X4_000028 [Glaciecola sp.]|jgi:hypothetical protein
MEPLPRLVIRDEGRHYATFARILRTHYAQRLGEPPAQLEKIRAHEGIPYANTFVIDHDDGIWTDFIFDRSVFQLKRSLGQARDFACPRSGPACWVPKMPKTLTRPAGSASSRLIGCLLIKYPTGN